MMPVMAHKEHQEEIKHYFKFIFRQYSTLLILISFFKICETDLIFKIIGFLNSTLPVETPSPLCPILTYWYTRSLKINLRIKAP